MTDKLRAAAETALEALDWVVRDNDSYDPFDDRWDDVHKAVSTLRQALAEPDTGTDRGAWSDVPDATNPVVESKPIGEIVEAHGLIAVSIPEMPPVGTKLYVAPPKTNTEPVAWVVPDFGFLFPDEISAQRYLDNTESGAKPTPLYTAPPKREWVGLTDEEIEKEHYFPFDYRRFARAIEAKLKEKNYD